MLIAAEALLAWCQSQVSVAGEQSSSRISAEVALTFDSGTSVPDGRAVPFSFALHLLDGSSDADAHSGDEDDLLLVSISTPSSRHRCLVGAGDFGADDPPDTPSPVSRHSSSARRAADDEDPPRPQTPPPPSAHSQEEADPPAQQPPASQAMTPEAVAAPLPINVPPPSDEQPGAVAGGQLSVQPFAFHMEPSAVAPSTASHPSSASSPPAQGTQPELGRGADRTEAVYMPVPGLESLFHLLSRQFVEQDRNGGHQHPHPTVHTPALRTSRRAAEADLLCVRLPSAAPLPAVRVVTANIAAHAQLCNAIRANCASDDCREVDFDLLGVCHVAVRGALGTRRQVFGYLRDLGSIDEKQWVLLQELSDDPLGTRLPMGLYAWYNESSGVLDVFFLPGRFRGCQGLGRRQRQRFLRARAAGRVSERVCESAAVADGGAPARQPLTGHRKGRRQGRSAVPSSRPRHVQRVCAGAAPGPYSLPPTWRWSGAGAGRHVHRRHRRDLRPAGEDAHPAL